VSGFVLVKSAYVSGSSRIVSIRQRQQLHRLRTLERHRLLTLELVAKASYTSSLRHRLVTLELLSGIALPSDS